MEEENSVADCPPNNNGQMGYMMGGGGGSAAGLSPMANNNNGSSSAPQSISIENDMSMLVALSQRITNGIKERSAELSKQQHEVDERIAQERAKLYMEVEKEREKLEAERFQLQILRGRAGELTENRKVILNVGGSIFTTSHLTLSADANSMLSILLNGGFPVETDETGAIIIDRDPHYFPLILEYLRALRYSQSNNDEEGDTSAMANSTSSPTHVAEHDRAASGQGYDGLGSELPQQGTPQARLAALASYYSQLDENEKDRLLNDVKYYAIEAMEKALTPTTYVVAADGSTKYKRISEALQDARDGDTVLVRRGSYVDSFVLSRRVNVVGEGPTAEDTVIRSPVATAIECRTKGGSIRNLTIEGITSESGLGGNAFGDHYGIFVSEGSVCIENCEIRWLGLSCVKIVGVANSNYKTTIRGCNIHNAQQCGILVTNHAAAIIENNEIHHNRFSGIEIRNSAKPQLQGNTIFENVQNGVYVHSGGEGSIENNKIFENRFNGINAEGSVTISRNVIYRNVKRGVFHALTTIVHDNNHVYNNILGDVAPKR